MVTSQWLAIFLLPPLLLSEYSGSFMQVLLHMSHILNREKDGHGESQTSFHAYNMDPLYDAWYI